MAEIVVEVVFSLPDQCVLKRISLREGATVEQAIAAAGLGEHEIAAERVGIFGRRVDLATRLRDGDRVEIYRPLALDPKEARRRRVRDR